MKKRLLSMLMAVLMIASLVPATALVASADCDHADTFSYSITNDAAKKQPGLDIEVCNDCGKVIKGDITPFADKKDICPDGRHTFKNEVLQVATCEKPSITVSYCSVCGTAAKTSVIVSDVTKLGHVYTQFKVVGEPTCQMAGWGYTVCDKCGEPEFVFGDDLYYTENAHSAMLKDLTYAQAQAVIAKFAPTNLNHVDKDAFVTDTKDVYDTFVFAGRLLWNDLIWKASVAPTHSLTVGGSPANYVVDCKGNDPYAVRYLTRDNYGCLVEDMSVDPGHGIGYESAKHCPYGDYDIDGKNLDGLNYTHAAAMDCIQKGYYPYIDKTGVKHDGVTDKWRCSICEKDFGGEVLPYNEYYQGFEFGANGLPTKGVDDGDTWKGNDGVDATCTTDGKTATVYKYVKLANGNYDWQVLTPSTKIDKLGHDLKMVESKAATCTEPGWTCDNYYVCARDTKCSNYTTANPYPYDQGNYVTTTTKEHNYVATVVVAPTCKNSGLSVNVCEYCKAIQMDDNNVVGYKHVPAVPHTAGDPVNAKEATCTEVGYTGDKVCKWCGIVIEKGKEIPMKEHTVVDVAAVEATCTTDGMKAGTKCSVCGTVLSGCEKVDKLGHDYKDGKCTRCGEKDPNYVAPEFKDAASIRDYAKDAVAWAAKEGIVKGDDNGNFLPTADITRQDFVTMLWRLKGSVASEKALTFGDKADIKDYAQTAVAWAVENGYIKGRDNGNFDPAAKITRAEIVAILNRIAENAKAEKAADFTDIATHWAKDAIAWAAEAGIVNGVGNNMFAPNDNASRQDTVVMLYKFVNLK